MEEKYISEERFEKLTLVKRTYSEEYQIRDTNLSDQVYGTLKEKGIVVSGVGNFEKKVFAYRDTTVFCDATLSLSWKPRNVRVISENQDTRTRVARELGLLPKETLEEKTE